MSKRHRSLWKWPASVVGLCVLLAACSSGGSSGTAASTASAAATHTLNLSGTKITVGGSPLKIAFFIGGTTDAFEQAARNAAVAEAKELGVQLTVFDGGFDQLTQANQVQQVLAQGTPYNAWIFNATSLNNCTFVKQALAKKILVSVLEEPMCGHEQEDGDGQYMPGTLNYVGGSTTQTVFNNYLNAIVQANPGPQKMIFLEGPQGIQQTIQTNKAIAAVEKADPQMKVTVANVDGYNLAGAEKQMATMLPANPDFTILATNYSDMTEGAVDALRTAGRLTSNLKIYDVGGSTWAVNAVKSGTIIGTVPLLPATEAKLSVESLVNAWKGERGLVYYDAMLTLKGNFGPANLVTKATVSEFHAEY